MQTGRWQGAGTLWGVPGPAAMRLWGQPLGCQHFEPEATARTRDLHREGPAEIQLEIREGDPLVPWGCGVGKRLWERILGPGEHPKVCGGRVGLLFLFPQPPASPPLLSPSLRQLESLALPPRQVTQHHRPPRPAKDKSLPSARRRQGDGCRRRGLALWLGEDGQRERPRSRGCPGDTTCSPAQARSLGARPVPSVPRWGC